MKKIIWFFVGVLFTQTACDLQPKILSFPDSVGDFISARYPALLADPNTHPEIYNSAVMDYGVYASPDLYGSSSSDAYVVYASVNDYIVPPQVQDVDAGQEIVVTEKSDDEYLTVPMYGGVRTEQNKTKDYVMVVAGDTLFSIAKKYNTTVEEIADTNNLKEPYTLSVGQKLYLKKSMAQEKHVQDTLVITKPKNAVQTVTKVDVDIVTVGVGDTLYSLSRKYSVPVNDLAVMNNLTAPFNLYVGQKLRVPDLATAPVAVPGVGQNNLVITKAKAKFEDKSVGDKSTKTINKNDKAEKKVVAPVKKISSDPNKKLPTISGRSSSKFSWPVRGKILSGYGAKSNGLFNDGINISAKRGTVVNAAENGVVAYAGNEVKGMGNLIIIQHSGGWMTVYAHLDSMNVKRGSKVAVGQKIGTIGETGKVDSPQLHFEIRKGTKAYDPKVYLKK